jgi:cytochrome c-type biogenesis protein CcmH/NrfG
MPKEKVIILVVVAFAVGFVSGTLSTVLRTSQEPVQSADQPGAPLPSMPPPSTAGILDAEKTGVMEQALLDKTRLNPDQAESWTELGNLYFDTNQYQKSIAAYERSLELKPNNPDVITDLGIMYRRVGNPQRAAELFRKASQIDPKHVQSLFNLGIVLQNELKDIPGAVEVWEKYLQLAPDNVHAPMVRALLEKLKKQGKESKK